MTNQNSQTRTNIHGIDYTLIRTQPEAEALSDSLRQDFDSGNFNRMTYLNGVNGGLVGYVHGGNIDQYLERMDEDVAARLLPLKIFVCYDAVVEERVARERAFTKSGGMS